MSQPCTKVKEIAEMRNAELHTMAQIGELARDIIALRERVAELELKIYEALKEELNGHH